MNSNPSICAPPVDLKGAGGADWRPMGDVKVNEFLGGAFTEICAALRPQRTNRLSCAACSSYSNRLCRSGCFAPGTNNRHLTRRANG